MASTGYKGRRIKMDCINEIRQSGDMCSSISLSQENIQDASNSTSCNQSFSSVPLLDMLAEVASATLKNDPSLNNNQKEINVQKSILQKTSTRAQLRKTHHSEYLTLDQIRVLSDKMLLEMFSELISDEIRRNYSYKCFLMPEKCSESFSSFGNENKARLQMKGHLLTHIAELLTEANAPGKSHRLKFVAEPLHVRKKRLLEGNSKKKRQPKQEKMMKRNRLNNIKDSINTNTGQNKCIQDMGKFKYNHNLSFRRDHCGSRRKRKNKTQSGQTDDDDDDGGDGDNKISDEDDTEDMSNPQKKKLIKYDKSYTKLKQKILNNEPNGILKDKKYSLCLHPNKKLNSHESTLPSNKTFEENIKRKCQGLCNQETFIDRCCDNGTQIENYEQFENKKSTKTHIKINIDDSLQFNKDNNNVFVENEPIKKKEYNHKCKDDRNSKTYQIDTLEQPQHDHCYTTVLGKRRGIGTFHFELSSSEDEENINDIVSVIPKNEPSVHLIISTPCFPFVFTPLLPNISQILEVSSENFNDDNSKMAKTACTHNFEEGSSSVIQKPKQTRIRRINRIIIAEELKSDSEEDSENIPSIVSDKISTIIEQKTSDKEKPSLSDDTKNHNIEGTPEWEKKLALKCIRALRYKKKEERGPLQCRICKDKKFTAQATLMYHYRSHAGIKPFTCAVCGATFTRQHSLNYHMLIHNNKSRFACSDCGRNFRHPSHYKEHLRRHTGETPYECSDCTLRFKTRNTFKRHLKTRHGKILTAQGIVTLTVEEFYKVRTTPRRRIQKSLPIRKKDQETQWPEIYTVEEEEEEDDEDDDDELNINEKR